MVNDKSLKARRGGAKPSEKGEEESVGRKLPLERPLRR